MSSHQLLPTAVALVLLAGVTACGDGPSGSQTETHADTLTTAPSDGGGVVNIGGKLFSIPSPVQTALMIRSTGAEYQRDIVLDRAMADGLTSKVGRALAMGLYGADLAYCTIHKDGQSALATLQTIEQLGARLELGNAFDKSLLDRFKENMNNQDSLLRLSGEAFRASDQYLKTNDRGDVSSLILAGGWLGSLHIALRHTGGKGSEKVAQRVGEQRRALGDLIALIEANDKEKQCNALCADLKTLKQAFDAIKSTYQFEKPVTDVAARTTFINGASSVTVTPEQLTAIAQQVETLRTKYLI
ncbi:MAG: hypothetical protein KA175_02425 [Flavobacteriales bacterium]|nr:hypothetical protein [Flavobacteriales bacterium]MBP6696444.1 hypothetical protein [Flavobacteriales bacterium]